MSLNKTTAKKERFIIPEGSHIAKLVSIVDLGTQDTGFKNFKKDKEGNLIKGSDGKPIDLGPKITDLVHLTFELQDVSMDDGRPAVVSPNSLNLSQFKKGTKAATLRLIEEALLGSKEVEKRVEAKHTFESILRDCLGKVGLLSIVHNESKGEIYSNFGSLVSLPSAMRASVKEGTVNPLIFLPDVEDTKAQQNAKLPKFVLEKINKRLHWGEEALNNNVNEPANDESPY